MRFARVVPLCPASRPTVGMDLGEAASNQYGFVPPYGTPYWYNLPR